MIFLKKRIQLKFDSIIFDLFKIKILLLYIPRFYSTYTSSQCWIWKLKLLFSALFYCPQEWLSDICYAIILIWWSKYFADIWIDIFFIHCKKNEKIFRLCLLDSVILYPQILDIRGIKSRVSILKSKYMSFSTIFMYYSCRTGCGW